MRYTFRGWADRRFGWFNAVTMSTPETLGPSSAPPAMCPEELEARVHELEWIASPYVSFGLEPGESRGMLLAYCDALPTLALGFRLRSDAHVSRWVDDLHAMSPEDRDTRIRELAKGAPRGKGQTVIRNLLARAADCGHTGAFVSAGAFVGTVGPPPESGRRGPKHAAGGSEEHDKVAGLVKSADRIVSDLVGYETGTEPTKRNGPDRRAAQRMLQEVAAHILRDDSCPASPAAMRRPRRLR